MQCFPQLLTGASCQYPIRKRYATRTVLNQFPDGREIKLLDPDGGSIEWQLKFRELNDNESALLQAFFLSMEGSLKSFTFLDPTENLLAWSEGFDQAAWQRDPMLQLQAGVPDPWGGTHGFQVTNPAGAGQRLRQTLNVPGAYYYAFSLWAQSAQGTAITMVRGKESAVMTVQGHWQRLLFAAGSSGADETVEFGIEVAPGASVSLVGAQVEAQIGASGYKKTTSANGIYTNTRFADDGLVMTTVGPARNGCSIRLRTN